MMNDFLDIHIDFNESILETDKRAIRFNTCLVLFNVFFLGWDLHFGVQQGNIVSQICLGAMIINLLWSASFLVVSMFEAKEQKRRLNYYKDRKQDKDYKEVLECYKGAINQYTNTIEFFKNNDADTIKKVFHSEAAKAACDAALASAGINKCEIITEGFGGDGGVSEKPNITERIQGKKIKSEKPMVS